MPNPPPRSPTQSVWVASFSPVAMASFSTVADKFGGLGRVVRGGGNRRCLADRLDPEVVLVCARRCNRPSASWALELRRKKSRCAPQDRDRSSQFSNSTLEGSNMLRVIRGAARSQTTVDFRTVHPVAQRVGRYPELMPDVRARPRRRPSSSRAARTNRTARSFDSGGYFLNFPVLLILSYCQEPPPEPGRNTACSTVTFEDGPRFSRERCGWMGV